MRLSFSTRCTFLKEHVYFFYESLIPFLIANALPLQSDFCKPFLYVSVLCLSNQKSPQEQGISLLKQQLSQSATYNSTYRKLDIKEKAVPNIPSRKTSRWKRVNKKRKSFFVPKSQCCQFEQDGWKNRTFFMKYKLNMKLQSIIQKTQLLRKSAAIMNYVKRGFELLYRKMWNIHTLKDEKTLSAINFVKNI